MRHIHLQFGALVVLSTITYLFSLVSQMLTSYHFGTGPIMDVYWLGLALAGVVTFYVHPFREAFVPLVFQKAKRNKQEANEVLTAGFFAVASVSVVVSIVFFVTLSFGFFDKPEVNGSAYLLKAFVPYIALFALSETCNALLTSFDLVIYQVVARLIAAIGSVICIALLASKIGVYALLISLFFGQTLTLFFSWRQLKKSGLGFRWRGLKLIGDSTFLSMFGSLIFNYFISHGYLFYERWTMSHLLTGSVAAYQYAVSLVNVIISIIPLSLINLLWPRFLDLNSEGNNSGMFRLITKASSFLGFVLLACSAYVFKWRYSIVRFLFARGAFGKASLELTCRALSLTVFAAVTVGLVSLGIRALVSQGRGRETVLVGLIMSVAGVALLTVANLTHSIVLAQIHWLISSLAGLIVAFVLLARGAMWQLRDVAKVFMWIVRAILAIIIPLQVVSNYYSGVNVFYQGISLAVSGTSFLALSLALALGLRVLDFPIKRGQRAGLIL